MIVATTWFRSWIKILKSDTQILAFTTTVKCVSRSLLLMLISASILGFLIGKGWVKVRIQLMMSSTCLMRRIASSEAARRGWKIKVIACTCLKIVRISLAVAANTGATNMRSHFPISMTTSSMSACNRLAFFLLQRLLRMKIWSVFLHTSLTLTTALR